MAAFIIVALLYLGGISTMVIMWWTAPEGFEDEAGFHFGAEVRPLKAKRTQRGMHSSPQRQTAMGASADWNTA